MISRFALSRDALDSFPRDLLDGSRETARMAERIVKQLGFDDVDYLPPVPLSDRLSWAIMALEEAGPTSKEPPQPTR